ncbi:hypothetical protein A8B82_09955 [Sulfitobacter sp. EhC04]|uniref:YhdP family protein n=1 Tax=Sulfitobacter sp. EhC04 TaxID=1849168 RepID=UPI0007F47CC4|nr:AsmA-like C-terminal region-containing protein [Sulfitobacter sp. EhC04]OAN78077.1 hypothetical protein A8B82_09955 [Sulfitobacter sp. EhC04]
MSTPDTPRPRRKPHQHVARFGLWSILLLTLAAGALVGAVYLSMGQPLRAPAWVQDRIEARIARELPQVRVALGEVELVVEEGWYPRVRLRNVAISTPEGAEILSLTEFKTGFALRPLLDGIVQPQTISLSGLVVTLRRDEAGRVALSAGLGPGNFSREAATLPQLIAQLDDLLQRPALQALTEAELRAVTLQFDDLRAGRSWTIDGGRLLLSREAGMLALSADVALLSGGAGVATLSANYTSRIGASAAEFGVSFEGVAAGDIATQGPAFAWLGVLRAPISGSVRSGLNDAGQFMPLNATLQIGAGVVQPNAQTRPIPFDGARSYFSYDPAEALLRFADVRLRSKWFSAESSGSATLGLTPEGQLSDLVGQFTIRDLRANPGDIYDAPVGLAETDLDFQMRLNPFRLQLGRVQISDQGKTLLLGGRLSARPDGWRVALDGQMDGLSPERLLQLWPEGLKPKTRTWLVENVLKGAVSNLDLALRVAPGKAPQTYVGFDYAGADVRFLKTMPPLTGGKGHFSLMDNRLVVAVDEGVVTADEGGEVRLGASSFIIPDVSVRDGPPAIIRLETASTVTAALSLLNRAPLNVMDKASLPVDLAGGRAALSGQIALPLKKGSKDKVVFDVAGKLRDVSSAVLVRGRALSAPEIDVVVDNERAILTGAGDLDGAGFDGSFVLPIGPASQTGTSGLRADVRLDQGALDAFGIALPPGTVAGQTTARLEVDLPKGRAPEFDLHSDLRGLRLSVPQLNWSKPPASTGSLRVTGRLGATPKVDSLAISGPGLSAAGAVSLREGGTLDRLSFDRLRAGEWLDAAVDIIGQGAGRPVQVVLRGGVLDLRRADLGSGGGSAQASGPPGPPMQVRLDRLQITDTIALTDMRGNFATAGGLDGAFQARLNGGTPVEGRIVPQNGRSAVRLISADAGGVLRAAGLLRQVVGGQLSLTLLPVGAAGAFDGTLDVTDVRVKDAPGIAALLNSISVVGLINELNGDGIYFDQVEGKFRLTPNRLTLTEASAVGASMGLSMDGIYALDSGMIDMQGVITPVYLLNGIGSVLTRKGEGLIGFNYTLKGPAKQPSVGVNPLSALTPGMFREIFRRPPPKVPQAPGTRQPPQKPVVRRTPGR